MSSISKYRCRLKLKINGGMAWAMIAQKECNDLIQRRKCLQRLWIFSMACACSLPEVAALGAFAGRWCAKPQTPVCLNF